MSWDHRNPRFGFFVLRRFLDPVFLFACGNLGILHLEQWFYRDIMHPEPQNLYFVIGSCGSWIPLLAASHVLSRRLPDQRSKKLPNVLMLMTLWAEAIPQGLWNSSGIDCFPGAVDLYGDKEHAL